MTVLQRSLLLAVLGAATSPLPAQIPDSIAELPEIGVRASRSDLAPGTAGLSITILRGDTARRGRLSPSLDELLAFVPGMLARDRSDYSLDTRIMMRGAGARANFGVRGVRVVIDGVPATLPDGQTPLTSLDLELADRIEVARGPLAALHGNGSMGLVAITTPARFAPGSSLRAASELGVDSERFRKHFLAVGGGSEHLGGMLAASHLHDDGLRRHSRAEQLRLRGGVEWRSGRNTTWSLRGNWADDASIQAPGALTLDEFHADPTAAAPNALSRNAGKRLSQQQLSLGVSSRLGTAVVDATAWTLWRDLENPIAAPAPAPTLPTEGVWIGIDRAVIGVRSTIRVPFGARFLASAGLDAQQMADDRVNRRHDAGVVSGPAFLDQREEIRELGAFAQAAAFHRHGITTRMAARFDHVNFVVDDRGTTNADGERAMAAWSVGGSVAWQREALHLWLGAGTAFETPTTTELANRPDGSTGLNRDLDPARTLSVELGMRTDHGPLSAEVVVFGARTTDAITPVSESGGRSFFDNVGETRTRGIETAASVRMHQRIRLRATMTAIRARFGSGASDSEGASIAGHRLPGVVPISARIGATVLWRRLMIDLDHGWSSAVWANDANTLEVPGWRGGVSNGLLRWSAPCDCMHLRLAARNIFDRPHATGVVVNGGFGRVVEPGNGRRILVGAEIALH